MPFHHLPSFEGLLHRGSGPGSPVFLFAAITVLSFCRILQVEWGVQTAMHEVVRGSHCQRPESFLKSWPEVPAKTEGRGARQIYLGRHGLRSALPPSSVTEDDIAHPVATYRINPVPLPGYKGFRIEKLGLCPAFHRFPTGSAIVKKPMSM